MYGAGNHRAGYSRVMYEAGYHRAGYNRVMYGAHCKAEQQLPNNICQLLEISCQPVGEGATAWARGRHMTIPAIVLDCLDLIIVLMASQCEVAMSIQEYNFFYLFLKFYQ